MSTFLNEVLASADEVELAELKLRLKTLNTRIADLKQTVISILETKFVKFELIGNESTYLVSVTKNLISEIEALQDGIENQTKRNLTNSTEELKTLTENLQEKIITIKIIDELCEIDDLFKEAMNAQLCQKYVDAAKALNLIQEKVIDKNKNIEYLHIYKGIRSELIDRRSDYLVELQLKWKEFITWTEFERDKSNKTVKLKINIDRSGEFVTALHHHQCLILELKTFADRFLKDILYKIITTDCEISIENETVLKMTTLSAKKNTNCVKVLNDLTVAFNFVDSTLSFDLGEDRNIMVLLGKIISNDFSRFLINHCLSQSVPVEIKELEDYKNTVAEKIVQLNSLLFEKGFFEENNDSILSYTENFETLLSNKMCQMYLAAARDIMKKDLNDMVEVGHETTVSEVLKDSTINLSELQNSLFQFPKCKISKSVNELLAMIKEILQNCTHSTGPLPLQLFSTARNIFKMYCHIIPEYHSQIIDSMPQKSALIHNNCMYLAHNLPILTTIIKNANVPGLKRYTITFIDIMTELRCVAAKIMQEQMRAQRRQLIEKISEYGLINSSTGNKHIQTSINNCLQHLMSLKMTWQHLLPLKNYCKIVGILCNAVLEEIYQKVSSAKDISHDTLKSLVPVLLLVQKRIPTVFPEPEEIQQHVKNWKTFCGLVKLQENRLLSAH